MRKFSLLFLGVLFSLLCEKRPTGEALEPFDGFTRTDPAGGYLSYDPSDWDYNRYLTVGYDTLGPGEIVPLENVVLPPYPNPAYEGITFRLGIKETQYISMDFYSDKGMNLKFYEPKNALNPGIHELYLQLNDSRGEKFPEGLYRVIVTYYTDRDRIHPVYKTSGDIQVY